MLMRIILPVILIGLITRIGYGQEGAVILDSIYFNMDTSKKMILVNKDIEVLNSSSSETHSSISSNGIAFTFITPVSNFKTDTIYKVLDINEEEYGLHFTQIPIVNINTQNTIVDEPRVYARFSLCEPNGNFIENAIGIEYRGSWTQTLPKKSLRIEFWEDPSGDDTEDFSLLGMREDDDWNIQAMYNEPLRLRSKIGYELWAKMDQLYYLEDEPEAKNTVRQEYVELFINNDYRGIYAISERIDRKQLKLKKYKDGEIRGELYKGDGWGASTFTSLPPYDNNRTLWGGLEYRHPDEEIDWSLIYDFVDFVINEDSILFYENYPNRFHLDNAVNYFIFLNLLRAFDNTGKNLHIAKYTNGEPYFYVPWDLDGTFGMSWSGNRENVTDDILTNGFYDRLLLDDNENGFLEKLKFRWGELRNDLITKDSILGTFTAYYNYLKTNGAYERENLAWEDPELFDYNNLEYTAAWLEDRLDYLDEIFENPALITDTEEYRIVDNLDLKIYPNPAGHHMFFETIDVDNIIEKIAIFNPLGQAIAVINANSYKGEIDVSNLGNGVYFIQADFKNRTRQIKKLIIRK